MTEGKHDFKGFQWQEHVEKIKQLLPDSIAFDPDVEEGETPFVNLSDNEFDGEPLIPHAICSQCGGYILSSEEGDVVAYVGLSHHLIQPCTGKAVAGA
jgi:hypothetical protein